MLFFGLIALILGLASGCEFPKTEKLKIFVSILPQKFVVERIGRDKVEVFVMTGPGQNPATYEPLPQQMIALAKTEVYFRIGVPFEQAWMKKIQSINPGMKIIDTRKGIRLREMDSFREMLLKLEGKQEKCDEKYEDEHVEIRQALHHGAKDPHIWLSPELVKIMAHNICNTIIELDSDNQEYYTFNLNKLVKDLDRVSKEIEEAFSRVMVKKMMVFHPAWGYFADRFGLIQIPIEIEGKEPGPRQLAKIIDFARTENIRVIFVQSQFSTKSAAAIAEEINGAVITIDPLAEQYIDNLKNVATTILNNIK